MRRLEVLETLLAPDTKTDALGYYWVDEETHNESCCISLFSSAF
jgi:hypothetical protein